MNFNNPTEAYMRTTAKIGMRQRVRPQDLIDLLSWLILWKPVGKILLVIFPFVLDINMFIASAVSSTDSAIARVDNQRHKKKKPFRAYSYQACLPQEQQAFLSGEAYLQRRSRKRS